MRPIYIFILLLSFVKTAKAQHAPNSNYITIKADSLLSFCKLYLGTHYKYGSIDPKKGFDCSGFVFYIFNHFNVKVNRSSIDYANCCREVKVDSSKIGDVIVFTGTNSKNRYPGHVGIVISNPGEELTFIHSSSSKKKSGIKKSTYVESPYYKNRFLKIVRVANVEK